MADEPKNPSEDKTNANPDKDIKEEVKVEEKPVEETKAEEAPREEKEEKIEGESKENKEETSEETEESKTGDKKEAETKPEENKEKSEPKKEEKPKLSKEERQEIKLAKKNTDPKVMELVEDIHELAEDLEDFNEEIEEEQAELESKAPVTKAPTKTEKIELKTKDGKANEEEDKIVEKKKDEEEEEKEGETEEKQATEPKEDEADTNSEKEKETEKPEEIEKPKEEEKKKGFLKRLFSKKKKEEKSESEESNEKPKKKKGKKVLIIVLIILLPIVAFGVTTGILAKNFISQAKKTAALGQETVAVLKSQNLPEAATKLAEVKTSVEDTRSAFQKLSYLKIVPGVNKYIEDGNYGFSAAISGIEAGQLLLDTVNPYADLFGLKGEGSFQGGTTEERIALILGKMGEITPNLNAVAEKINQVQFDFDQINPSDYPEIVRNIPVRSYLTQARDMLDQGAGLFSDALPMMNVLPKVFGYPDQQKYMVMFQNDGELRATGGFMSAYSLVNVLNGKVVPEISNDIYYLDNNFNGNLEPPEFIKTHLNEKKFYLRNMNTSPDFMVSMNTFYENVSTIDGYENLDGIIAIDTYVLEKIIEILGPVEVPGYGTFTTELDDRCNLSQVVCELEHIIDKPLATVASNRKSDILGPMMKAILAKLFEGGSEQLAKLAPLGFDLLEQKHIITYFTDETVEDAAEAFNIAGRIQDYDGDYLHVNNSNLGGAKSNFYISEEFEQKIEIADDGTITKTVEVAYTHNEPGDNCNLEAGELCLSGIQRNYFRIYVPEGSTFVDGLGSQVEFQTGTELGKTYFDGFFELNPESVAKVRITYTLPFKAESETYNLLTQKQPGTRDIKNTVEINGQSQEFILNKDTELNINL